MQELEVIDFDFLRDICVASTAKIVLLVLDGLGGLPREEGGKTELETAFTPNLDALAAKGMVGLINPVGPGITPGSGPAHLALFGYDPVRYQIGRGVLEALGIGFDLKDRDVAARANFATVDAQGLVSDRRAGRLATEKCLELCGLLRRIKLEDVELFVEPVKEHRFVVVFRGSDLSDHLTESDPQKVGLPPGEVRATRPKSARTARIVNEFVRQAHEILANHYPANAVLLRGFAQHPKLPTIPEIYGLQAAAIAVYPMYRGLAKLAGMSILATGTTVADEFATLAEHYASYDYFFIHVKGTDTAGEDGDFARKVRVIEEVDAELPTLLQLNPDVVVVTGDHSTPALLRSHSWHPVPFLLYSRWCRADAAREFGETACASGSLGTFPAVNIMGLALANALRLTKFGA
ncbi:MAG: 2,3-bisphosphoglycerate-independent phosphoglycerate mutase [Chloroflexi bacterium]|nr:2,3-bisphosphoglycerate-independent phosphoglycerate mutase [Chloroflexota bacterium]